jgi:hypothetical protein
VSSQATVIRKALDALATRLDALDMAEEDKAAFTKELEAVTNQAAATVTARKAAAVKVEKGRVAAAEQADIVKARAHVLSMYSPGDTVEVDFDGNVVKAQVQADGRLLPFYGSPAATALAKAMARTALGLDDSTRRTVVEMN